MDGPTASLNTRVLQSSFGNTGHVNSYNKQTINVFTHGSNPEIRHLLAAESSASKSSSQSRMLPPMPKSMFGRDQETSQIVHVFTTSENPRVVILGPGGMGKTTLAESVIHSAEVIARYGAHRHFARCEAATSVDLLWSELADVLEIPTANRDSQLQKHILQLLDAEPTLLCLDNFETPWLEAHPRRAVDEFLLQLDSLQNLGILITMRGIERPGKIEWSLIPPLAPLEPDATEHILEVVSRGSCSVQDEFVAKIIGVIGGVPLASTLVGTLLRDELETSESLWNRWEDEKTSVIEIDSNDRLFSLDVSIQVSPIEVCLSTCAADSEASGSHLH